MNRTIAIIQARLGSRRLPRKTLEDIAGRPMVLHVVDRVAAMPGLDGLVVAIPDSDDELGLLLDKEGIPIAQGPELDVLHRFVMAAEQTQAETIVRVTADCPLWCPAIGARVLQLYRGTGGCDYAWNVVPGVYVDGTDTEVFSRALLHWADEGATDPADREHVGPWMRKHGHVATLSVGANYGWLKTSVDDAKDVARVRAIAARIPPKDYSLGAVLAAAEACLQTR